MLGWEYPPHISGGLGTACEGLTKGLARIGVGIDFVVPHLSGDEEAPHMLLFDSFSGLDKESGQSEEAIAGITKYALDSALSPYWNAQGISEFVKFFQSLEVRFPKSADQSQEVFPDQLRTILSQGKKMIGRAERYGSNIFDEVHRYASNVADLMSDRQFDVVHAHDWMTYPAGVALSKITGKPLVVHVHSLEYDRSGEHVNQQIYDIERMGLEAADAVIAVSYYTRNTIRKHHGIPEEKILVVHNGVYPKAVSQSYRRAKGWPAKVVLFLGRITFQKGPDYFVEAAAKVVPHVPDVLFVMAGAGDMLPRMIDRVYELGIAENFYFPGFLQGSEVEEMFSAADLYVMPSVSEPFGISALEAISFDTPVIISRQSGVSEVLGHALKADFWDIDRLADLIINGLCFEELRQDMISMAREELKRVRWDAAALKTLEVYRKVLGA